MKWCDFPGCDFFSCFSWKLTDEHRLQIWLGLTRLESNLLSYLFTYPFRLDLCQQYYQSSRNNHIPAHKSIKWLWQTIKSLVNLNVAPVPRFPSWPLGGLRGLRCGGPKSISGYNNYINQWQRLPCLVLIVRSEARRQRTTHTGGVGRIWKMCCESSLELFKSRCQNIEGRDET